MIYVIGIGVDGKESLTPKALGLIEGAGLLVGGRRHLDEFPGLSAGLVPIKGGLERVAARVEAYIKPGNTKGRGAKRKPPVVVLATGDPSLYGIADFIVKRFGKKGVRVIPNVSVVQEAFARIKENMRGLKVFSAHGRSVEDGLFGEISASGKAAVFTDPVNTPERIASALVELGVKDRTAYVCSELGGPKESVVKGTLADIAARGPYPPLNTMIIIDNKGPSAVDHGSAHSPGIPDSGFVSSTGMMTKEEVRVVALSKLRLKPGSVVWDVGAGSGSVSVEAALVASKGRVWAIEKNKARVRDIKKNKDRFGAASLEVVEGSAPAGLKAFGPAAPDAVFVGGGGKDLPGILAFVARRVKKGGRVVVNAVTMETASFAFDYFKKRGWTKELVIVSVTRAKDVGGLSILSAGNPVLIITGIRP